MSKRAIFFDRDGTVNVEKEYNYDPDAIELIEATPVALRLARDAGFLLFIVSNQSGIARGLATIDEVDAVNNHLAALLRAHDIEFDGIYYCPHLPEISGHCGCRKPGRGMIDQALAKFDIDLRKSYVIGDRLLDVGLAHNVGAKSVMVRTGYGSVEEHDITADLQPAYIADDILDAVNWILREIENEC